MLLFLSLLVHLVISDVVVETTTGTLRGVQVGPVTHFLGIPYAVPPVGPLRWKPPQPVARWSGVKDASNYGPVCYQPLTPKIIKDYTFPVNVTESEDCLFLNVWTPSQTAANLPVMVWIHGGGLAQGGNSEARLVGEKMAGQNVVLVNINYRLGVLGFLANEALMKENSTYPSTGNYGLEDQRLALQWVKDNIHAFGGDPEKVTIMGESAGGTSVCLHIVMEKSAGLFQQAVIESGACFFETRFLYDGYADSAKVIQSIGCADPNNLLKCMRETSPSSLIAAQIQNGLTITAYVDGYNIVEHPYKSVFNNRVKNKVPLLAGNNANEGTILVYPRYPQPVPAADYKKYIDMQFRSFAPYVEKVYPCTNSSDCREMLSALIGDFSLTCPTYVLAKFIARSQPVYTYLWVHEPSYIRNAAPYLGAFHSSEVAFVFSTYMDIYSYQPEEATLAAQLTSYWAAFGTNGAPSSVVAPPWPSYATQTRQVLNVTQIYHRPDPLVNSPCDTFWVNVYWYLYASK